MNETWPFFLGVRDDPLALARQSPKAASILDHFCASLNRRNDQALCFVAFPSREPVSTSLENALDESYKELAPEKHGICVIFFKRANFWGQTAFWGLMGIEPIFDAAPFGAHVPQGALARYIAGARGAGASWLGRGRAALMRRAGLRAIGAQPVDCEAFGVRLRLYPQNNLTDKRLLFTPEKFDARERAFLAEHMRDDLIFLDIGANIGAYSLFVAAQAGPRARILAVEPQPDIHARLVYNIRQNGFSCVKTLECALSDCEGAATLFVDARNRGESSLRLVPTTPAARIQVRAQTLEHIVAQEGLARIDMLKLDCEGAEDLVLEPFLRRAPLSLFPKILLMERNPACWCVDLFALARAAGYREVLRTDQNIAYELADPQRPD